jgi:hypothetical protein
MLECGICIVYNKSEDAYEVNIKVKPIQLQLAEAIGQGGKLPIRMSFLKFRIE